MSTAPAQPARTTPIAGDGSPLIWQRLDALFGAGAIANFHVHEYDQSIELYFAPGLDAGWVPAEADLRAVCALGFLTVYGNFADDTEYVAGWKMRIENGVRVPGGDYWVASPGRSKVGFPRYARGAGDRAVVLQGEDVALFREFLAWRAQRA